MPTRQLLVYTFGPGAGFEGQLVGALERIESGGAIRVLDALFVTREPPHRVVVVPLVTVLFAPRLPCGRVKIARDMRAVLVFEHKRRWFDLH